MTDSRLRRPVGAVLLRGVVAGVLAGGLVVAMAGPASAHAGDSPVADNFSGSVTGVSPALPAGISIEVLDFGSRLRLTNESDQVVSVPGYSAEPYLEIGPDGVRRNENSPASYLNLDAAGTTPLPESADPQANPAWVVESTEPVYEWHDHRTHWMSAQLPAQVRADPGRSHRVIEWTVPLEIGGRPYEVSGALDWNPPPPGWLSYLVLAGLVGAGVVAGWVRGSARLSTGLLVLAVAGSVWHALSTPLAADGFWSRVYEVLSVGVPTVVVLVLAGLAVQAVRPSPATAGDGPVPYLVCIAGWLLVAEAVPDLDMLFRSNLLAAGPAWAARLAVLLVFGLGAGLAIGAVGLLRAGRRRSALVVAEGEAAV